MLAAAASFATENFTAHMVVIGPHGWLPSLSKGFFSQSMPSSAEDVLGLA
jgi:hypothetical protein